MENKQKLFDLAWPIFITNILGILLEFIDVYVLSRVDDLAASAVGTACQITSVSSLIFSVVCGATGIFVTQYLGSGRREDASKMSALCITMNVLFGCVITVIVVGGHDLFLGILGAEGVLFELASKYIAILGWSIVLDAYQGTIGSILYSHGKTKIAMYLSGSMGILNLILDVILVLGLLGFPAMGVRGAAIATVTTKCIGSILESAVVFSRIEKLSVFRKLREVKKTDIAGIFKIGVPTIFDSVNYSITQLVITGLILHNLPDVDIVARTYLQSIAVFFQLFTNAVASATQILVGYAAGAGDYEHVKKHCRTGLELSFLSTGVISITACFFSAQLFGIFTENPAIISLGQKLMVANVAVELGRVMNVGYIWCLRGVGDVSIPVLICVICMWVVAVGGSYTILKLTSMGMLGIIMIAGLDEWIRGALMHFRWKSEKWRKRII